MKRYRIVVVENDEDEQFFMREGFSSSAFDIMAQLTSGDEFIEWIETNKSSPPDIILSDLNMPGKNGYDVIDFIVGNPAYQHIPVIITSTSSTPATIEKCREHGASFYLTKPDTFVEYPEYAKRLYEVIEENQLARGYTE